MTANIMNDISRETGLNIEGMNLQLFSDKKLNRPTDRMNLQLFSDTTPEPSTDKLDPETGTEGEPTPVKTYTEEEVEKMVQSETDRRVNKALEKKLSEFEQRLETEKKETERLAKLSEVEKQKELDLKREQDLARREQELTRKTLELDAMKELSDRGLPSSFIDIVVADTSESTLERITSVEETFRNEIQKAVDERLKGSTPKSGQSQGTDNPWKKETFNLTKQMMLLKADPVKAKQMMSEAGIS